MNKNIYTKIEEAKKLKEDRITDFKEKLARAEETKAKAGKDLETALSVNSAEAYTKAKAEQREAEDVIEFCKLKINEINKNGIFPEDEVSEVYKEIKTAAEDITVKNWTEILKALADLMAKAEETANEIIKANKAIEDIQKNTNSNNSGYDLMSMNVWGSYNAIKSAVGITEHNINYIKNH